MIIIREERAQSAVYKSRNKNFIITGFAFTTSKTTRETAIRGEFVFIIDRKGHEICARHGIFGTTYCGQQHSITHLKHHGSICLLGKFAGFKGNNASITECDGFGNNVHKYIFILSQKNFSQRYKFFLKFTSLLI